MTLAEEFRSRNFSIYGQWTGVLCVILCFALGIANIFHLHWVILFSVLCLISSFIILFIEVPLLLRICPTSAGFDAFIRRFETNYMRAAIYAVLSIVQFLSMVTRFYTSLIAAAVFLMIAAIFYALAGVKGQAFINSKTLGGQGVAQMIV
ncbi:Golgi apparatus membrane protein tvp18 [Recurvomyces mirabilis]|uniref:Golgi apparatus membrane protein tvp18 n=1 Tax=Recurvomyces mirabilis TaxID=574656 RepID=A0AAE0WWQ2_9PEZI|nr:Golgi apparatus membrane protein tvp18 [Recurvomyces mirabilis]KAK5158818.1 Golgi apparatus membrane protein tvp18 [Recurvomyces mirabilis]